MERVQDRKGVAHDDFFTKFKPGLVEVVYEWARGMVRLDLWSCSDLLLTIWAGRLFAFSKPFEQITDLTDVAEGTIVRCITRLDETCREVRDAARVIGDKSLFSKMEQAQSLIKRDSGSSRRRLYLLAKAADVFHLDYNSQSSSPPVSSASFSATA